MKLSEAILLGSTLIELNPSLYLANDCGCLLGMGGRAIGKKAGSLTHHARFVFPEYQWLFKEFPCPAGLGFRAGNRIQAFSIIGAMAWKIKHGEYTIEQAVDWVRSVEPPSPPSQEETPAELEMVGR